MTNPILLSDLITEKNLTEPQVVISYDARGLHLLPLAAILGAMDAIDAGDPEPSSDGITIPRGSNVVNNVMRDAQPGDTILFTVEGHIVNVNFLSLREDLEATVRKAIRLKIRDECDN